MRNLNSPVIGSRAQTLSYLEKCKEKPRAAPIHQNGSAVSQEATAKEHGPGNPPSFLVGMQTGQTIQKSCLVGSGELRHAAYHL